MIPFSKVALSLLVSFGSVLSVQSDATQFCMYFPGNEPIDMEVDEKVTLGELESLLSNYGLDRSEEALLAFRGKKHQADYGLTEGEGYSYDINNGARDFYHDVTIDEKQNIAYIVKTLANKNEASLLIHKGSIQGAGKKVDHVHPLKFLFAIFDDEELKVGIRNIRKRSWVWKSFRDGIADSLRDEQNAGNMKEEYLYEFAAPLNLDSNMVYNQYVNGQWAEFVEGLVTHVPRKGNPGRFNMSHR